MSPTVSIAVHGAAGRMGQEIVRLAFADPRAELVAAIIKSGADEEGQRVGPLATDTSGIRYSSSIDAATRPSVLIDFSSAPAFDDALALALSRRSAFVSGTTGLSSLQFEALRRAATTIPALWSANFSIGVAVLASLAYEAARALAGWDCEIAEAHHRHKKDAPSGTALMLGRVVADARGEDFARVAATGARAGARDPSTIGFAVSRGGDIVGEHTVTFAGDGERIELTHRATDRTIFARGALEAALWLADRRAGLYTMADLVKGR